MEQFWAQETCRVEDEMKANWLERHLVPLSSVHNYEVKRQQCFLVVRGWLGYKSAETDSGKTVDVETWVQTADGRVGGRIDTVIHWKHGIQITDYKSGAILDPLASDHAVRKEYQDQLKLYAALYYSAFLAWPVRLTVLGLDRCEYEIPFAPDECMQLLESAKALLERTNQQIETGCNPEDLARPSPEHCRHCSYRPACRAYWKARTDDSNWPADIQGSMTEKYLLANGALRIIVWDKTNCAVRGLSPARHDFLGGDDVKHVLFCDLGQDKLPNYFFETMLTTGYALSDA
jgi:hypothetical protein